MRELWTREGPTAMNKRTYMATALLDYLRLQKTWVSILRRRKSQSRFFDEHGLHFVGGSTGKAARHHR
jgi:hypothetical protein